MTIAVDFDGTIVEHQYPRIGKPIEGAIPALLKFQEAGHRLILWTYRNGSTLEDAVNYCEDNGINLYAVNASSPGEVITESNSRLIKADVFIDDRNVGGLLPWAEVESHILGS
ncbi:MAG: hydrolase [Crocinitomicaceae bacterium]|nr:hydrolase [Crocinitomicaceae bacterium]|tara:strand:- start:22638 stop:22976 length:339 start_codon:yes stop_codon:yes gene_type:complete